MICLMTTSMSLSGLITALCVSSGPAASNRSQEFVIRSSEKSVHTCGIMATSTSTSRICLTSFGLFLRGQHTASEAWLSMSLGKPATVSFGIQRRSRSTCFHSVKKEGCNALLYVASLVTQNIAGTHGICNAIRLLGGSGMSNWLPRTLVESFLSSIAGTTTREMMDRAKWSSKDVGWSACTYLTLCCIVSQILEVRLQDGVNWYIAREFNLLFLITPLHIRKWLFIFFELTIAGWRTLWLKDLGYTYGVYGMHNNITRCIHKGIRYTPIPMFATLSNP